MKENALSEICTLISLYGSPALLLSAAVFAERSTTKIPSTPPVQFKVTVSARTFVAEKANIAARNIVIKDMRLT